MPTNIKPLLTQTQALHKAITAFAADDGTAELLKILRQPGWTTIAEEAFFLTIVQSALAQVQQLHALTGGLVKAAGSVGQ